MLPIPGVGEFNITEYVQVLWKRKWLIAVCIGVSLLVGVIYVSMAPRIYMSNTVILIEKEVPRITQIKDDVYSKEKGDIRTQYGILHSRYLAERVIKKLKLNIGLDPKSVDKFLSSVKVERNGNIFVIYAFGSDPVLITDISNTWVKEFIRQDIERRMGTTEYGVIWLEDQLSDTLRELQVVEAELSELTKTNVALAEMEDAIAGFKSKKKQINNEIAEASRIYGDKHPKIIFLKEQLELIRRGTEETKENVALLHDEMWQYRMLVEKAQTYRGLYNQLLSRSRELDISKDLAVTNIRVVDVARVPTVPVSPQKQRTIMLAFFVGLALGGGISFLLEFMDATLKKAEHVEIHAGMPFLGYAPSATKLKKKGHDLNILTDIDPYSQAAEAFRNIKVSLVFSSSEDMPLKKILITSPSSKDGKTFVASNLAINFAHGKEKTLLIDADMRKGKLIKSYKLGAEHGLTSVLAGVCDVGKAIAKTEIDNLSLLPSGPISPNPSALLSSVQFKKLINELESKFDRIIIDAPAIIATNDALFWGEVCDGMIEVIGAGVTSLPRIVEANKKIEKKVKIIGGVLNNLKVEKDATYYYHYFQEFVNRTKNDLIEKAQAKKTQPKKS